MCLSWHTAKTLGLRCLYTFLFRMHSASTTSAYIEFETSYAPVMHCLPMSHAMVQGVHGLKFSNEGERDHLILRY